MAEIDLTPTEEMAANAARGLELRRKHGKGGTEIGVARARDISNRKNLSPETVRRMHAFFSRHEKNKAGGEDDAGYIAWLLWGGDSGQSWAKRKVEQMDKGENQRSDTYKEIAQRLGSAAKFANEEAQMRELMGQLGQKPDKVIYKYGAFEMHFYGRAGKGDGEQRARRTLANLHAFMRRTGLDTHGAYYQPIDDRDPSQGGMIVLLASTFDKFSRPGAKAKMGKDRPLDVTKTSGSSGGTWRKVMTSYGNKKAAVLTFIDNGQVGQVYQDPDNPSVYKAFDMDGTLLGQGSESEMKRRVEARNFARLGSKVANARTKYVVMLKSQRTGNTTKFPVTAISEAEAKNYANAVYGDAWKVMSVSVENSRPGAKAKMGREKTVTVATVMSGTGGSGGLFKVVGYDENGREFEYGLFAMRSMAEQRAKDVARWKDWKYTASRPGAKAKMATEGRVKVDGVEYRVLPYQVEYFKSDLAKFDDPKWRKQVVQQYLAKNYIVRASRPGAKAKMAANEVDLWNYLSKSDVVLARQNATDLATLKRYAQMALTKPDFTPPSRAQHGPSLHAMAKDTLADIRAWEESVQRHRNRMSRPGAKAKMALTEEDARKIIATIAQTKASATTWSPALDAMNNQRTFAQRLILAHQKGDTANIHRYSALLEKAGWSRPGAKAKFAVKVGDRVHAGVGTAGGAGVIGTVTKIEDDYAHIQADASVSDRYGAKTYKAPLRLVTAAPKKAWESSKNAVREGEKVSASDDAVSRKIRKLMDEGKPQKQAVAIALDLERRGEL